MSRRAPVPADVTPHWAAFTIQLLDTADWNAAAAPLRALETWTLRLTTVDGRARDVRLIDARYIHDTDEDADEPIAIDRQAGILAEPLDDDGNDVIGAAEFVPYEDIDAIGIY